MVLVAGDDGNDAGGGGGDGEMVEVVVQPVAPRLSSPRLSNLVVAFSSVSSSIQTI